jgi:hypothetical protein
MWSTDLPAAKLLHGAPVNAGSALIVQKARPRENRDLRYPNAGRQLPRGLRWTPSAPVCRGGVVPGNLARPQPPFLCRAGYTRTARNLHGKPALLSSMPSAEPAAPGMLVWDRSVWPGLTLTARGMGSRQALAGGSTQISTSERYIIRRWVWAMSGHDASRRSRPRAQVCNRGGKVRTAEGLRPVLHIVAGTAVVRLPSWPRTNTSTERRGVIGESSRLGRVAEDQHPKDFEDLERGSAIAR